MSVSNVTSKSNELLNLDGKKLISEVPSLNNRKDWWNKEDILTTIGGSNFNQLIPLNSELNILRLKDGYKVKHNISDIDYQRRFYSDNEAYKVMNVKLRGDYPIKSHVTPIVNSGSQNKNKLKQREIDLEGRRVIQAIRIAEFFRGKGFQIASTVSIDVSIANIKNIVNGKNTKDELIFMVIFDVSKGDKIDNIAIPLLKDWKVKVTEKFNALKNQ